MKLSYEKTLVIVLDRINDPITPLLNQWTYQAMVSEVIGLENNLIKSGVIPSKAQYNLSIDSDDFFSKNAFSNFGDLANNLKLMVDQYQDHGKNVKMDSIEDMQKFVEDYEINKKKQNSMTKHVEITSYLSKTVGQKHLLDISKLEQDMASSNNKNSHFTVLYIIRKSRNM